MVADYAVRQIIKSSGVMAIADLARDIGYSRQHLTRLFKEQVGVSPKELAGIVRFQRFYSRINTGADIRIMDERYDYYYDYSHFAKEFQRYAGYSPSEYTAVRNEFGRIFYRNRDVPFLQ